jgi:dTDP-4-dehydrorhamnose reductase
MNVLVTGGSGLLGRYLLDAKPEGVEAHFTWYTRCQPWTAYQMDVCDRSQVSYVFGRVRPQAVIHMAAAGSVDWCERNYREAWRCNVEGTDNVLEAAKDYGAKVLLTSTNAVFDGESPPYAWDSPREPVNAYGKMRRGAEDLVARYEGVWQVVRLFLLYGWEPDGARGNWASNAVRKLRAGERLRVVDDVFYQPTYAEDAAISLWWMLAEHGQGYWHVSGGDTVSLHEFVLQVARTWGFDEGLVEPISIEDLPQLAPRPRDSSYAENVDWCRGVESGLAAMRAESPCGCGCCQCGEYGFVPEAGCPAHDDGEERGD